MQNPYAPPNAVHQFSGETGRAWREGDLLVLDKGASLPDRCVRCNAPAGGYRLTTTLVWYPGWVWLTLLAGWLVLLIVALVVRKSGVAHLGLCDEHRARRRRHQLAAAGSGLFVVVGATVSISLGGDLAVFGLLVSVVLGLASLVVFLVLARIVKVVNIDQQFIRIRPGDAFLESYPRPVPGVALPHQR